VLAWHCSQSSVAIFDIVNEITSGGGGHIILINLSEENRLGRTDRLSLAGNVYIKAFKVVDLSVSGIVTGNMDRMLVICTEWSGFYVWDHPSPTRRWMNMFVNAMISGVRSTTVNSRTERVWYVTAKKIIQVLGCMLDAYIYRTSTLQGIDYAIAQRPACHAQVQVYRDLSTDQI
jgi:hypothetical protein